MSATCSSSDPIVLPVRPAMSAITHGPQLQMVATTRTGPLMILVWDAALTQAARGRVPEDSDCVQSSFGNKIVMTGSPWSPGPMISFSVTGFASVENPSRGIR